MATPAAAQQVPPWLERARVLYAEGLDPKDTAQIPALATFFEDSGSTQYVQAHLAYLNLIGVANVVTRLDAIRGLLQRTLVVLQGLPQAGSDTLIGELRSLAEEMREQMMEQGNPLARGESPPVWVEPAEGDGVKDSEDDLDLGNPDFAQETGLTLAGGKEEEGS